MKSKSRSTKKAGSKKKAGTLGPDTLWYAKWLAFGFVFGFVLAPALLFGLGKQMPETRLGLWAHGVEGKMQAWYHHGEMSRLPAGTQAEALDSASGSRARAGYLNP